MPTYTASPTSVANLGRGGSVGNWASFSGSAGGTTPTFTAGNSYCDYAVFSGFGFSVPSNEVLTGITLHYNAEGFSSGGQAGGESSLKIYNSTGLVGQDRATVGTNYSNGIDVAHTVGGATDTWGANLLYSDVNASLFGIAISIQKNISASGNWYATLDTVSVTLTTRTLQSGEIVVTETLQANHAASPPPYWVDCGINIKPSTTVYVWANGIAEWSSTPNYCTPDGDPNYPTPGVYPAPGTPLANNIKPFSLGLKLSNADPGYGISSAIQGGTAQTSFSSGSGGKLWMCLDDLAADFADNSGSWTVYIRYVPVGANYPPLTPTSNYGRQIPAFAYGRS